jgi:hypothetical protein
MNLDELYELRDMNELDMLYKLIEIADSSKKRMESFIKGNKTAGKDVRKSMMDIILVSEIIRDEIQKNKGITRKKYKKDKLAEAISIAEQHKEKEDLMFLFEKEGIRYQKKDSLDKLRKMASEKGLINA